MCLLPSGCNVIVFNILFCFFHFRLLLFQEKEQLLRELRSITPHTRSHQEMSDIQGEIKKLEQDLNNALELSNRAIANRYYYFLISSVNRNQ